MAVTKKALVSLLVFLVSTNLVILPISHAKAPKKCGKESPNVRAVSKVLCPDGSPNSEIFVLLRRDMERTTSLKKGASASQIRRAICTDAGDAIGPTVDNVVRYMFAWHEWKVGGLSYKSIMNSYYWGDWEMFCSGGSQQSDTTTEGKLSKATGDSWGRWLNAPSDLYPFAQTIGKFRWYRNANDDCWAIEFEKKSDAESAARGYSAFYAYTGYWVLYVGSLLWVVIDNTFGNSCSKGIKSKYGGIYP
jgi:hypothetical protein